jgi:Activator of Hsp90 ATPase homolog 1-like protein
MPIRVEVPVNAPLDVVWEALTDADEIQRWFGWEYDGLEEEVKYIFVDHATQRPPDRIDLEDETGGQAIRLVPDDSRTVVAVDSPDELAEGWRMFFCQLSYYLEHHRGEERRTVHLSGEARPRVLVEVLEGEPRRVSPYVALVEGTDGLSVLRSSGQLDSDDPANAELTVSAYGRDEDELAGIRERWQDRWRSVTS